MMSAEKMVLSRATQHDSIPCYNGNCDDQMEILILTQVYMRSGQGNCHISSSVLQGIYSETQPDICQSLSEMRYTARAVSSTPSMST